jgi:phage/plasmid-like protein (TIGR03299 family)
MDYLNNQTAYSSKSKKPMLAIGAEVCPTDSLDTWIEAAGLDFHYNEQPLSYTHNGETIIDRSKKVISNSKTGGLIHVPSSRFKTVQPEPIVNVYREITEKLGFEMSILGQFGGGAKIWGMAKAPNELNINGDKIEGYLMLATGNDGTMPTIAKFAANRPACMNQTPMLFKSKGAQHKTRHSTSFDANKMIADMGLLEFNDAWENFEIVANRLIDTPVTSQEATQVIHKIFGTGKNLGDESTRTKNIVEQVYNNLRTSAGSELVTTRGTAWGVLNAITYYTDHQQGSDELRTQNAYFGRGETIKNNALELLGMIAEEKETHVEGYTSGNNALELLGL